MKTAPAVRDAEAGDAEPISKLLGELGYPAVIDEIPRRLAAIADFHDAIALVAVDGNNVVGLITAHVIPMIHESHPFAMLTTLVVAETHRSGGIGSLLVSHIERWAATRGAVRVSVTSGIRREQTHGFYERREYAKTGFRFTKKLDSDANPALK